MPTDRRLAWRLDRLCRRWPLGWDDPTTNIYLLPAIVSSLAAIYLLIELVRIVETLLAPLSLRETSAPTREKNRVA
jgi:hypothetical protein